MSARPLHSIATPRGQILDVMDLPAARAAFQGYDLVISLLDPGMVPDWPEHPGHHVYAIRDLNTAAGADQEVIRAILVLPSEQARRVLIHCEVGVSRSPAVAILLAARLGAGEAAILQGIHWPAAVPNPRILELGEALLGTGGRLRALVARGRALATSQVDPPRPPGPAAPEETPARHRILLPGGVILDVRGLPEALTIYQNYDAVISLQDPWADPPWRPHPRHWIFPVRDIEGQGLDAPSLDLVRRLLAIDLDGSRTVLVHCHEGFSRSTATAILLATRAGADPEAILAGIDWTHAYPNRKLLAFGEQLLGTGGTLADLVEAGLRQGGWQ